MNSENKIDAKMEFLVIASELMPKGKPDFIAVIKFPMVKNLLIEHGRKYLLTIITMLVKDFCGSLNVVRNMNEDQMIEAANMLIDECDNFRLEDYTMMFQMAKRGELFEIRDRVDLQIITQILDAYWQQRHEVGESEVLEKMTHYDSLGNSIRLSEQIHKQDEKLITMSEGLASALGGLKDLVSEKIGNAEERKKLREIELQDSEQIKKRLQEKGYND